MSGGGRRRYGWLALLLVAGRAWSQAPAPVNTAPAVEVTALFVPEMAYQTTVLYRPAVSEGQAREDLAQLASLLGYDSVDALRRSDLTADRLLPITYEATAQDMTVGFRLTERALNRDIGTFKLEPFITAFRRYKRIDLDFMVGDLSGKRFAYRGLGDYADRTVRIRHHSEGPSHAFAIEVLDPGFTKLELPPFAPPVMPLQADQKASRESRWPLEPILLGLSCAGVALVAFMVVYWGLRRWGQGSRRRRAR